MVVAIYVKCDKFEMFKTYEYVLGDDIQDLLGCLDSARNVEGFIAERFNRKISFHAIYIKLVFRHGNLIYESLNYDSCGNWKIPSEEEIFEAKMREEHFK